MSSSESQAILSWSQCVNLTLVHKFEAVSIGVKYELIFGKLTAFEMPRMIHWMGLAVMLRKNRIYQMMIYSNF